MLMKEPSQHIKKRSHAGKTRQVMSARQMQKLVKNDESMFLQLSEYQMMLFSMEEGPEERRNGMKDLLAMPQ